MQTIPGRDEGGRTLCSGYAAGLARRAYAPAFAPPSAAEPRRSATGRAALDFSCKIGEGNDGFVGGEDANRRHDFGAGLSVWTAAGCGRAGKGGISAILPRPAARGVGAALWPRGRRSRGRMPPQLHCHSQRQVLG